MFRSALVIVFVVGAVARPDVSHLQGVKKERTLSSYDAPVNSVNGQYVKTTHAFHHNEPYSKYFPYLYASGLGNRNNQVYYLSQSGQQLPFRITSGNLPVTTFGGQNVHYVSQGQGQGLGNVQYVSQGGLGGNVHHVVSQGGLHGLTGNVHNLASHGIHHAGNVHNVGSQGGNVHYVSQGVLGGGNGNVQYVSQGAHGGVNVASLGGQGQSHGGSGHVVFNTGGVVKNQERVYYFAAPEDIVQHSARLRINVVPTHSKNTNVIVVKAPSVGKIIPEVVAPSHSVVEEKTKVVVLVKENDHYVPLTVNAPAPISTGKAEVVVVKYHDKNDVARVESPKIIQNGDASVLSQFGSSNSQSNVGSLNIEGVSHGGSTGSLLTLVNGQTSGVNLAQNSGGLEVSSVSGGQTGAINANQGGNYQVSTVKVSGVTPVYNLGSTDAQFVSNAQNQGGFEINSVSSGQTGTINTNVGGSGQTFEVNTVAPIFNVRNTGSQNIGARFGGDNSGHVQGYTLKSSEFTQNFNGGEGGEYGHIDNLKKVLGDGIEIVSVSKGTLQASGVGDKAQDSVLSSLGVSGDFLKHGIGAVSDSTNNAAVGNQFYQSSSSTAGYGDGHQIQIGNDVAEVLTGSSLKV